MSHKKCAPQSNKEPLSRWLRTLEVAPVAPQLREQQLEKARLAFVHAATLEPEVTFSRRRYFPRVVLPTALAACVCLVLLLNQHPKQTASIPGEQHATASLQQDLTLLTNVQALFGAEFGAYLDQGRGSKILFAQESSALKGAPLRLELRVGSKQVRILTFAGQSLRFEIDGRPIELEILERGDGTFLIVGQNFVIENHGSGGPVDQATAASLLGNV